MSKATANDTKTEQQPIAHGHVWVIWSSAPFETLESWLHAKMPIKSFVRPFYHPMSGKQLNCQYVAVLLPRIAEEMKKHIAKQSAQTAATGDTATATAAVKSKKSILVTRIEPLNLSKYDMPMRSKHSTDSFFLRLPQRMTVKTIRTHLHDFFESIRGQDLLEEAQCKIVIPMTADKAHHKNRCVIQVETKEIAEEYRKADPDKKIKLSGKASEANLPFVRYLLHNHMWPSNAILLDNDPVMISVPKGDVGESVTLQQRPVFYAISCEWNRLTPTERGKMAAIQKETMSGPSMHITVHPPRSVVDADPTAAAEDQDFSIAATEWAPLHSSHPFCTQWKPLPVYYTGANVTPQAARVSVRLPPTAATTTNQKDEKTDNKTENPAIASFILNDFHVPVLLRADGGCFSIQAQDANKKMIWTKYVIFDLDPTLFPPPKENAKQTMEIEPWVWTGDEKVQCYLDHDEPSALGIQLTIQKVLNSKTDQPLGFFGGDRVWGLKKIAIASVSALLSVK